MAHSIGVDLGGTKILAGLVDEDGTIVRTARRPTPRADADHVLAVIAESIAELTESGDEQVVGVGVGVAGLVDNDFSQVFFAPNLRWHQVPARAVLESATGLPVIVENDGNIAAWGEYRFGAGRGLRDIVVVTVGTGIGGGIISEGRLFRGGHGAAGEIGHINAVPDGRPCGCGRGGCLEQYASGSALVREARALAAERRSEAELLLALGDGTPEGVQGVHVTQAARAGDPVAIEAFTIIGTWLGRGMADLAAVLDPQAFVIGGGVSDAGDLLITTAQQTLTDKLIGRSNRPAPQIRIAELTNNAGLVGAADLVRTRLSG